MRDCLPYGLPFLLFALITVIGPYTALTPLPLYAIKSLAAAAALYGMRRAWRAEIRFTPSWLPVLAGALVYLAWVGLEGGYPTIGTQPGFDPSQAATQCQANASIALRLTGAVLVVPLMEELFWRSLALRLLIETNFRSVPLGQFSWFSFIGTSLAFGFEHERWLPGILAGAVYAGLLYRRRNLLDPIVGHAVTNLLLGIHVIARQQWFYW